MPPRLAHLEVLTPERHDAARRLLAGEGGDAIALQPGAVHHEVGLERCLPRGDHPAVVSSLERRHAGGCPQLAAECGDLGAEGCHHRGEVDDSFLGHMHGLQTPDVRLDLEGFR